MMKCPAQEGSHFTTSCNAHYCPPKNGDSEGFSWSICTLGMTRDSSSKLVKGWPECEYSYDACNYSCDYLKKNAASLPTTYFKKKLMGDILNSTVQTNIYVGCVPGNVTSRLEEIEYSSEITNPPSSSSGNEPSAGDQPSAGDKPSVGGLPPIANPPSGGNQLTNSLFLPLVLIFILLLKMKLH